jgi:hypothetical protein
MNVMRDAQDYALYVRSGGFTVHSIARQEEDRIVLLAQGKQDQEWHQLAFTVDSVAPHPILGLEVRAAEAPGK